MRPSPSSQRNSHTLFIHHPRQLTSLSNRSTLLYLLGRQHPPRREAEKPTRPRHTHRPPPPPHPDTAMSSPANMNESISKTYRPRRPSFFLSLAPTTSTAYFPPSAVDTTADAAPVEHPAVRRSSSAASDQSQVAAGFRFLALGHGPELKEEDKTV